MTKQPSYRFVRYTEAWEQRKLGEVAQYRNGKAHENCIDENGKYIVVNSKFISTDGEVKKFSNKKNEALFENEIAFVLSDVPNGRAIARTFWVEKNDKYTLNQRIAGITPIGETFPYFLYILMNRHPYFLAFDDGAKQTNLSVSDVMGFEAYYPKYSEQQKIGAYFRNLDHLITLQQRKLEVLKEQKKTYLKLLFPAKGQTKPDLRFAGFEDEWKEKYLYEVLKVSKDRNVDLAYDKNQVLSVSREAGVVNQIEYQGRSFAGADLSNYKIVNKENLIYTKSPLKGAPYGIFQISYTTGIVSPLYAVFKSTKQIFAPFVGLSLMDDNKASKYLSPIVTKGAKNTINITDEGSLQGKLLFPSMEEQRIIHTFFQDLDKAIAKQEEKVNQLKESKQTLLRKMFI